MMWLSVSEAVEICCRHPSHGHSIYSYSMVMDVCRVSHKQEENYLISNYNLDNEWLRRHMICFAVRSNQSSRFEAHRRFEIDF